MLPNACAVRERAVSDGFGAAQEEDLRSRRPLPGFTEVDKWKRVWRILFPNDAEADIPEPCT